MTDCFESVIGPRINNILAVSEFMAEDINQRFTETDEMESSFSVKEDYSFGWRNIIENTIYFGSTKGFVFSGVDGCGKHTAAEIACNVLISQKGFSLAYLSGDDFIFSEAEVKADESERQRMIEKRDLNSFTDDIIHSFFECLFSQFDEGMSVCLVIDDTDINENIEAVYRRLEKYLCIGQPQLFVIIIEKNERIIPSMLRKQIRLIRMTPPDQKKRLSLLENILSNTKIKDRDALQLLSKATEDYTYSQLRDLACNIKFYALSGENITDEFLNDITASQYPVSVENSALAEEKLILYRKLRELIDMAPELLTRMPAATVAALPAAEPEKKWEDMASLDEKDAAIDADKAKEKSRIEYESERMELGNLMGIYLGEERMQKINHAVKN